MSAATMPERVSGHAGAPQTVYSDDYLWPTDGGAGFKLEVSPVYPMIAALVLARNDRDFIGAIFENRIVKTRPSEKFQTASLMSLTS